MTDIRIIVPATVPTPLEAWSYVGVPYPTTSTSELVTLGYSAWPYDPCTISIPALPSPWTSEQSPFYYIDESTGTDSGRTFGDPTAPRLTIPTALPAGSVVVVAGSYTKSHSSPSNIVASGTSASPVFITSASGDIAVLERFFEIGGTHFIVDGLSWVSPDRVNDTNNMSVNLGSGLQSAVHATFRNNLYSANFASGGVNSGGSSDHVMIYNNTIKWTGDIDIGVDTDRHGTNLNNVDDVWIIENIYNENSGDAVQTGGQNDDGITCSRVWIAGNTSSNNRQNGFHVKEAQDVIIVENEVFDNTRSAVGGGGGFGGGQFDNDNVWFLRNTGHDNLAGIHFGSGTGNHFFLGNLMYDTSGGPPFDETNPNSKAALSSRGHTGAIYAHNTLIREHAGFHTPQTTTTVFSSNIIGEPTFANASHTFISNKSNKDVDFNVWDGSLNVRWGSSTVQTDLDEMKTDGQCASSVETSDLKFVDADNDNFRLAATSPALDVGEETTAYATFQTRYGIDIRVDLDGVTRPQNGTWNAGAYESNP